MKKNKKWIWIALAIIVFILVLSFGGNSKQINQDVVYQDTINISRSYAALRLKTDKLLMNAKNYKDYNSWNKDMTKLIDNWKNLETKSGELEDKADTMSQEKLSLHLVSEAKAYSKSEISNVFDKAPAGKKIKTLAKYLGVDAKRAYKILQSDQEFVKADAWNEAGDTFKKLETSAVVLKDGCKVAAFVGAAAMTGGASTTLAIGEAGAGAALAGGTATAAEATVMVVTGTDLMLEVSEDGATVALGDNHKLTKYISGVRKYTEPAASLLSLTDIPSNIGKGAKALDKLSVVLVEADQVRSMLQDGKLLGINIRPDKKDKTKVKVELAPLKEKELKQWIEDNQKDMQLTEDGTKTKEDENTTDDLDKWLEGFENLDDWMDDFDEEVKGEDGEKEGKELSDTNFSNVLGGNSKLVEEYKEQMKGRAMYENETMATYRKKFSEMYNKGLINKSELDELINEAERLSKAQYKTAREPEDRQEALLAENAKRKQQDISERGDMTKMTFREVEADSEKYLKKNEIRKAWLKGECDKIFADDKDRAEYCYVKGI